MKVTAKVSENDDSFFGFRDLSGTDMDFSGLMDLRRLQNLDFKYDFDFDFPSGRSYRFNSDELRNELNEDMKELKRDLQELERELRELKRSGR